ncbi:hypothetical protein FHR91_002910 [Erythrobacter lutimaris]|nr:hypothetical protein [Alteriqipengyuania lutimaris]
MIRNPDRRRENGPARIAILLKTRCIFAGRHGADRFA